MVPARHRQHRDMGGNPEKPVDESGERISPRRSFKHWQQTYRNSSEPWTGAERNFASRLRPLITETLFLQMHDEGVRLNELRGD